MICGKEILLALDNLIDNNMKRIIIICEGQTEVAFCNTNLYLPLFEKGISIQTPLIKASQGGIVKWSKLKTQIELHLKTDPSAYVTTFIDYYGLYSKYGFPNWQLSTTIVDHNKKMACLEQGMADAIHEDWRYRFIPYLQLHEFEGLLFNDINIIYEQIPTRDIIDKPLLVKTFQDYNNPEMINDGKDTAPSKRLEKIIAGYRKVIYGDILSEAIGLPRIRAKSPRFNEWVRQLESI
jgi:hypothetical protein